MNQKQSQPSTNQSFLLEPKFENTSMKLSQKDQFATKGTEASGLRFVQRKRDTNEEMKELARELRLKIRRQTELTGQQSPAPQFLI